MKKKYKNILSVFFVIFLLFCGENKKSSTSIKVAIRENLKVLNPQLAMDISSYTILSPLFYSLFEYTKTGKIRPQIVEGFYAEDKKIVFKIKKGLRFSSGKLLTAYTVWKNLMYFSSKDSNFPYKTNYSFIKNLKLKDERKIIIEVKKYSDFLLEYFVFPIIDEDLIGKNNVLSSTKEKFRIKREEFGLKIETPKNIVEIHTVKDTHTAYFKLLRGEIDLAVGYEFKNPLSRKIKVVHIDSGRSYFLVFNLRKKFLKKALRREIFCKISDEADKYFDKSKYTIRKSIFFQKEIWLNNTVSCKKESFKNFKRKALEVLFNAESEHKKKLFYFLKEILKTLNLDLKSNPLEYGAYLKRLKEGTFILTIVGFFLSKNPDISELFSEGSRVNYSGINNRELIELFGKAFYLRGEKRTLAYRKINSILNEEIPMIPLPSPKFKVYERNGFKGVYPEFLGADNSVFDYMVEWRKNVSD